MAGPGTRGQFAGFGGTGFPCCSPSLVGLVETGSRSLSGVGAFVRIQVQSGLAAEFANVGFAVAAVAAVAAVDDDTVAGKVLGQIESPAGTAALPRFVAQKPVAVRRQRE